MSGAGERDHGVRCPAVTGGDAGDCDCEGPRGERCPNCAGAYLEECDDYDDASMYCPSCSWEKPRE